DNLNVESNKTKDMINVLNAIKAEKNILIVVDELTDNVILSTRNIPNVVLLQYD
ncbi:MAG: 50S ribosomal protein L4, partial [Bacilli bacterium]|nr:50S ribosomal protein L4 [Bacilli bacterium]